MAEATVSRGQPVLITADMDSLSQRCTPGAKVLTQGSLSSAIREATSDQLGDARLVTKGILSSGLREATSVHLGDLRLALKSDISSIDKRLDGMDARLDSIDATVKRLEVTHIVTLCVTVVGAWYISEKQVSRC